MDQNVEPTPFWNGFHKHDTENVLNSVLKRGILFHNKARILEKLFSPVRTVTSSSVSFMISYRNYDRGRKTLQLKYFRSRRLISNSSELEGRKNTCGSLCGVALVFA